jgi:1,4-dihydroxy-2-naphthoate octaprenyltransferase
VLFGKHTDKMQADRAKGVNTLPVLLGETRSRSAVKFMLASQYLLTLVLIAAGIVHWILLVVFIALPRLRDCWQAFSLPKPEDRPEGYPVSIWPLWFSAHAFSHTRVFTSLFLIGILIDSMVIRFFA